MPNLSNDLLASLKCAGSGEDYVDRIMAIIEHIPLFEDFEPSEIEVLSRYMRCYQADAGIEVIREGQAGDFMLLVISGSLEILKQDAHGLPQHLATVGPGKTIGEMSVIDGEPRFASCVTQEETFFAVLDRESLTRLIAEQSMVGVKILMELLMLLNQRLRTVSGELMKCLENQRLGIR